MYPLIIIRVYAIFFVLLLLLQGCNTTYQPITDFSKVKNDSLLLADSIATSHLLRIKDTIRYLLMHDDAVVISSVELKSFYLQSNNEPIWQGKNRNSDGIALLKGSKFHGLNPNEYGVKLIDSLNNKILNDSAFNAQTHALIDVALSEGVLKYCEHLFHGKLKPKSIDANWNYSGRTMRNTDSIIYSCILNDKVNEIEWLFEPKYKWYSDLKTGLHKYYQLEENNREPLQLIYPGMVLHRGDSSSYLVLLKKKLNTLGLYTADSITPVFDSTLESSVKDFQNMHGLTPDGIPGVQTYLFLNWTLNTYIEALKVNMERTRWLPDSLPITHLMVNIPAYNLKLYHNSKEVFSSKVIVGKVKTKTPIFLSNIEYLVYNPCWTIPNSIATKKILPKLKTDSTYLDNHNMFICLNGKELNSGSIDYSEYSKNNFPYKIFQRSGSSNALGKVKFMFPNKYHVFLHDTPSQYLFKKDARAYSSGCIRVQHALKLASLIHSEIEENNTPMSVYLKKGYPEIVTLKKNIPINIFYLTCISNGETSKLYFYKDIYLRDYKVLTRLLKIDNSHIKM